MRQLKKRVRLFTGANKRRREARQKVLTSMPKRSVCAEIGVWKGNFSARILEVVQPVALHLIDPWEFIPDERYKHALYGGRAARGQQDIDRVFENVQQRFAREIGDGVVHLHRSPSAQAAREFANEYFDWIYIDGNHYYEFVKQDMHSFCPRVKSGGFIAGDDYGTRGYWKGGVKKAVDEFIASQEAELVLQEAGQFVLRKS